MSDDQEPSAGAPRLILEQVGQEMRYGPQQTILRKGDLPDFFYVVQSGRVRVYDEDEGIKAELDVLGPGQYFGEMGVVTGLPRSATVETLEETVLQRISQPEFDWLLDHNPRLNREIIRQLSHRLREGDWRIFQVAKGEAKKRNITWVDYLLILGLGLILGVGFNLFNTNKIPLVYGWSTGDIERDKSLKSLENIQVEAVSPAEARQAYKTGKALFVDAQKQGFYKLKHVEGAYNLDPLALVMFYPKWLSDLGFSDEPDSQNNKDTPIIVYGGNISRPFDLEVARFLKFKDHTQVRVLAGGPQAWKTGFEYGSNPEPPQKMSQGFLSLIGWLPLGILAALFIPGLWRSPYLSLGCRMVLGVIFVSFSLSKIIQPAVFAQNTIDYQLVPAWGVNLFSLGLSGMELAAGLFLLLGIRARAAATFVAGMNLIFIVGLSYVLSQGWIINCGCGAEMGEPVTWWKVAKNMGMLVMSLQIFRYDKYFVLDRGGFIWQERRV